MCDGCLFDDPPYAPECKDVIDHASSPGGIISLGMVAIESGYWRATSDSTNVFACYVAEACLGGVTGSSGYCLEGNEGPCESCSFVIPLP